MLLIDLALILVCARLAGAAARRIGQPQVVGEIVSGVLLGPAVLGPSLAGALFPADVRLALEPLANLGLVLFMFGVGYELDHRLVRQPAALSVAAGSTLLPFALGSGLALWLATRHQHPRPLAFVLFVAIAMSVTAFPVLARILVDRGLAGTRVGALALSSAAVADVAAWSLLAVVVGLSGGKPAWSTLLAVPAVLAMVFLVRPRLAALLGHRTGSGAFAVVAAGLLLSAAGTELLGLHFIFGAFLFGAICPRQHAELQAEVVDRLTAVGRHLLLPVFFVVAGFQLDLTGVDLSDMGELAAILAVAVGGKLAGAYLPAAAHGLPRSEAATLAVLMNTRGLTEIVVLSIGLRAGILDHRLYSLMVVMALATTAMTGPLLSIIGRPTTHAGPRPARLSRRTRSPVRSAALNLAALAGQEAQHIPLHREVVDDLTVGSGGETNTVRVDDLVSTGVPDGEVGSLARGVNEMRPVGTAGPWPMISATCARTACSEMPDEASALAATPSPSRSSPRRMCSVPR
jgi:Kef-type K+ transport system membrane component KefB